MELRKNYNPDILTCISNLSSDEVFTPPEVAKSMLNNLPKQIWQNEEIKFLDPVSKTGVFLREITTRLIDGLEKKIPNLEKRINHILRNQVYGLSITELTSLIPLLVNTIINNTMIPKPKSSLVRIFAFDKYNI